MPRDTEERPGSLGPSVCCVFPAPLHVVWKLPRENGGCSLWTESSFLLTDQVIWLLRPSEKISLSLSAASKFSRIRGKRKASGDFRSFASCLGIVLHHPLLPLLRPLCFTIAQAFRKVSARSYLVRSSALRLLTLRR